MRRVPLLLLAFVVPVACSDSTTAPMDVQVSEGRHRARTQVLAQEQQPVLEPGDTVRVTAPNMSDRRLVGTYWGIADDRTLMLTVAVTEDAQAVPLAEIGQIEVFAGDRSHAWLGAAGGFSLFLWGGVLATNEVCKHQGIVGPEKPPCPETAWGVGVLTGLVGAGIGALIGSEFKSDKWEPVELPAKPMVAVHPTGRFRVGLTIPLRR